jgi:hypothetical protein
VVVDLAAELVGESEEHFGCGGGVGLVGWMECGRREIEGGKTARLWGCVDASVRDSEGELSTACQNNFVNHTAYCPSYIDVAWRSS